MVIKREAKTLTEDEILQRALSFREQIDVWDVNWLSRKGTARHDVQRRKKIEDSMLEVHEHMPSLVVILGSEAVRNQIYNERIKRIKVEKLITPVESSEEIVAAYTGALTLLSTVTKREVQGQIMSEKVFFMPGDLQPDPS